MSLVLEALRRRQSEDDPGTAVTLTLAGERQRRQRTWMILLTAALVLNAAVLAWLFGDRPTGAPTPEAPTAPAAPPGSVAPGAEPVVSGTAPTGPMAVPQPVPAPAAVPAIGAPLQDPYQAHPGPAQGAVAPMPMAAVPARVLERIELDSLPPAARSRFPGIVISTHVYAEDPALRAIVVNGERVQEGGLVSGLTLREINEFGIVLEFESYLVDVPVFTDW